MALPAIHASAKRNNPKSLTTYVGLRLLYMASESQQTSVILSSKFIFSLLSYFRIRYSPSWSTEVKKMHRSVYLESKLINTDSNHHPWPDILSHVTSNHISEISVTPQSHSLTDLVKSTIDNYFKLPGYELQRHR